MVGFIEGCPGVGLVLYRLRTRYRVFKESLATVGSLLIQTKIMGPHSMSMVLDEGSDQAGVSSLSGLKPN